MKNVIIVVAVFFVSTFALSAQSSNMPSKKGAKKSEVKIQVDSLAHCFTMKGGEMRRCMGEGKPLQTMENDSKLKNGTIVKMNGDVIPPKGSKAKGTTLQEGQCINQKGIVGDYSAMND